MLPMAQTPIASKSAPLSVWDFPAIIPLRYKMAGKHLLSKHFSIVMLSDLLSVVVTQ